MESIDTARALSAKDAIIPEDYTKAFLFTAENGKQSVVAGSIVSLMLLGMTEESTVYISPQGVVFDSNMHEVALES